MVRLEIDRLKSAAVIPAKAGIYVLRSSNLVSVDPRLRGDDGKKSCLLYTSDAADE